MKKIKLNSNKLNLKKENIGNLLSKETMKNVIGGKTETGYGPCTDYTQGACGNSAPPKCGSGNISIGCPPSADCSNALTCRADCTAFGISGC
jgi:hypothetical protein